MGSSGLTVGQADPSQGDSLAFPDSAEPVAFRWWYKCHATSLIRVCKLVQAVNSSPSSSPSNPTCRFPLTTCPFCTASPEQQESVLPAVVISRLKKYVCVSTQDVGRGETYLSCTDEPWIAIKHEAKVWLVVRERGGREKKRCRERERETAHLLGPGFCSWSRSLEELTKAGHWITFRKRLLTLKLVMRTSIISHQG